MKLRRLGRSDLMVSEVGLGTMTFGKQTGEADAHRQLDMAVDHGVNLVDTGELYPVPDPDPETQGRTETFIGNWIAARGVRDRVLLATKVVGDAPYTRHIRGGRTRLTRANIREALDGSLARLRTDHVDLYQVHWPARKTNALMQLGYVHDPADEPVPIAETLEALDELVKEGKVRAVGLSNETPWGLWQYLTLARERGLTRVASVQNAYSLLSRGYEVGMAEIGIREEVGLIAYQLIGMGMLTGKHSGGARPADARLTVHPHPRYTSPSAIRASEAYVALARNHGLDPAGMAMAFVTRQPFVASSLVAARTAEQLEHNLRVFDTPLDADVLAGIDAIHHANSNPAS